MSTNTPVPSNRLQSHSCFTKRNALIRFWQVWGKFLEQFGGIGRSLGKLLDKVWEGVEQAFGTCLENVRGYVVLIDDSV